MVGMIFTHFGGLQISWSYYDTLLEIMAMRELGISEEQAHIVFATLSHKTKLEIAICLLGKKEGNDELIKAIRNVSNVATRNHLIHSLVHGDDKTMTFTKREVSGTFKFKQRSFDDAEFEKKFNLVCAAIGDVESKSGITSKDVDAYTAAALT